MIAEQGGIRPFLERNPIAGIRILPAQKRQNAAEDIELGMDAESYLTAQALSPEKQNELRGRPAEDVATDLVEDATVRWAAERLAAPSEGPGLAVVEDEVLRALLRGLKATQVAERVLQKLGKIVQDAHLPQQIYDRIRDEVRWFSLSLEEKHARLMQLERSAARDAARHSDLFCRSAAFRIRFCAATAPCRR